MCVTLAPQLHAPYPPAAVPTTAQQSPTRVTIQNVPEHSSAERAAFSCLCPQPECQSPSLGLMGAPELGHKCDTDAPLFCGRRDRHQSRPTSLSLFLMAEFQRASPLPRTNSGKGAVLVQQRESLDQMQALSKFLEDELSSAHADHQVQVMDTGYEK